MTTEFDLTLKGALASAWWRITEPSLGSFRAGPVWVAVSSQFGGRHIVEARFGTLEPESPDGPFEPFRRTVTQENPWVTASRLIGHYSRLRRGWTFEHQGGNSGGLCSMCRTKRFSSKYLFDPWQVSPHQNGTVCCECLMTAPGALALSLLEDRITRFERTDPFFPSEARLSLSVRQLDSDALDLSRLLMVWTGHHRTDITRGAFLDDWLAFTDIDATNPHLVVAALAWLSEPHLDCWLNDLREAPVSETTRRSIISNVARLDGPLSKARAERNKFLLPQPFVA